MPQTARPRLRVALAAAILAAVAAVAHAHGNSVIDLEGIETHVAARAAATSGPRQRAYRALSRALGRENRRPLIDEIAKLVAVAQACEGKLRHDTDLDVALGAALIRAADEVRTEPEVVQAILRKLERKRDRSQVARSAASAAALLARAERRDDPLLRARLLGRAARGYDAAMQLGRRLILRAIRHGAPGQPITRGPSGTIDTYAGTGAPGPGREGNPARAAAFYLPQDVAIDPSTGLVHIVDLNNHRVRRIDADGRVRTVAGDGRLGDTTGPARQARLHHPTGIAFHPVTGDLFIAGWHSSRVLRLDRVTGEIVYASGSGELGFSGDGEEALGAVTNYPVGFAFAQDGTWYFGDQGNFRVRRVDGTTNVIDTIAGSGADGFAGDGGPARDAAFHLPYGDLAEPAGRVCLSPDERWLYVADTGNHRVRRIDLADPDRTITTYAGNGVAGASGDGDLATSASMIAPVDVACDASGNLFVCDRDAAQVRRVDVVSRRITTVAGNGAPGFSGDGGKATSAKLDLPSGICVDLVRGRIYVADTANHVIRVVWE